MAASVAAARTSRDAQHAVEDRVAHVAPATAEAVVDDVEAEEEHRERGMQAPCEPARQRTGHPRGERTLHRRGVRTRKSLIRSLPPTSEQFSTPFTAK